MQVATLAQDAFHVAAPFAASGVRHDAVVAEVVASAHDADETRDVRTTDALRHNVAIGLCRRELHVDGLMPAFHLSDEVGQREIAVGTSHEVGIVLLNELFLDALSHTAKHTDDERIGSTVLFTF